MARKTADLAAWPSLTLEGNLIAPAMLAQIASKQDDAGYGLLKGLTLRDEISRAFRIGQAHFDAFAKIDNPTATATINLTRAFLAETFGFIDLTPTASPLAFTAGAGRIPVVVVPPADPIDRRSAYLSTERSRSAAFALQDSLNADDAALWGLATNGTTLRLMRDNASLTRPAYIEANLAQIFQTDDIASFSALWLLIHRSRFGDAPNPATDCALERWRDAGSREGAVARDKLAKQVEHALKILGSGFLDANPALRDRLTQGALPLTDWFNELLRLVYRLIFLMVAEDRALLHTPAATQDARKLYTEGYSLAHLRAQSIRRAAWDRHHDRYEGLKVVFRALTRGEPLLGLPALGGLFGATQLPDLETARLPNRALMEALYRLSWLTDAGGMVPVNWRAMETEELGSVYESLLELQPQLADNARSLTFATDTTETKGNQRKTTGSYYTPDSLVQALLDTALNPVLDATELNATDPAEALLNLTITDPACGSGPFLLAAAHRIATRVAFHRANGTPSATGYRHALRDVARRCLHGVDRNPMAVELTKVALWIETVDPGKPLGFFDAQIRCGDALLGLFDLKALQTGIPDAAYKPLAGDDTATALYYRNANRDVKAGQGTLGLFGGSNRLPALRPIAADYTGFRALSGDSLDEIATKSRRFHAIRDGMAFHKVEMAADLYTAAYLLPKTGGAPISRGARLVPTSEDVWQALDNGQVWGPLIGRATVARTARAFHWPLEFPDVMAKGGFDVVLGNPPWEVMQLSDKEYFATRKPEIAALAGAARKRAIDELERTDPPAYFDFTVAKRVFDASNEFARESGRFDLTAKGKVNTYSLFAELFANLARGRAGVIVPTGIATDFTTAPFFADLVTKKRLSQLVDFENSAPIFPSVHRSFKFSLLTLGHGEGTARFAFFLTDPAQLAEPQRNFTLSPGQIARLNPNTKTAPVFRSRMDAELTAKIYENAPVLIDEAKGESGNPWGVEFRQGLFNMTSDSHLFRTAAQLTAEGFARDGVNWRGVGANPPSSPAGLPPTLQYVPLYEAKMGDFFDHRAAGYGSRGDERGYRVLPDTTDQEHGDATFESEPFYWVPESEVATRLEAMQWHREWLLGFKNVTSPTNERTFICNVFPRWGVGNSMPVLLPSGFSPTEVVVGFVANASSIPFDFVARQKAGGINLNFFYVKQFPILPPTYYTPERLAFLLPRVLELTYTSHALAPFARDLGHEGPPFAWDAPRRADLRADLDAFYARAYGLTRDELRYILDPADVMGPTYPSETFRVLKEKEHRLYGEYRTQRLVLAAWDRMEQAEFAEMAM